MNRNSYKTSHLTKFLCCLNGQFYVIEHTLYKYRLIYVLKGMEKFHTHTFYISIVYRRYMGYILWTSTKCNKIITLSQSVCQHSVCAHNGGLQLIYNVQAAAASHNDACQSMTFQIICNFIWTILWEIFHAEASH